MLKVVYFDEQSAIDYLDIFNGGILNKQSVKETTTATKAEGNLEAKAKTGVLFKAIKPIIDINLGAGLESSISRLGESAVKTTISNTVLSDFIICAEKDDKIEKTSGHKIYAYKDSITFFKMYTPYLKMIKLHDENINHIEADETLENGKGYYELIAENEQGNRKVLRFNIQAFRNNYKLVDLTKMDLTFYSVRVGQLNIDNLVAQKEFEIDQEKELTIDEVLQTRTENNRTLANVYDVIIAGING